jgi:hypothetical protein
VTQLALADLAVEAEFGWRALVSYGEQAALTVRWYDFGGEASCRGYDGVTLTALGRLAFFSSALRTEDAGVVLRAAATANWASLPVEATLEEADPSVAGGLYDTAEAFYRTFVHATPHVSSTEVSKLLHLNRPGLFPVLDTPVRVLYAERAAAYWRTDERATRPLSGKSYWPVIRSDLVTAGAQVEAWRTRLFSSDSDIHRAMGQLSSVRLWDIVVRSLGVSIR